MTARVEDINTIESVHVHCSVKNHDLKQMSYNIKILNIVTKTGDTNRVFPKLKRQE